MIRDKFVTTVREILSAVRRDSPENASDDSTAMREARRNVLRDLCKNNTSMTEALRDSKYAQPVLQLAVNEARTRGLDPDLCIVSPRTYFELRNTQDVRDKPVSTLTKEQQARSKQYTTFALHKEYIYLVYSESSHTPLLADSSVLSDMIVID